MEAVGSDAFDEGSGDSFRRGLGILPFAKRDSAEAAALAGADGAGCGIEAELGAGFDPVGEEGEDGVFRQSGGGEDARAGGGAGDFGDGKPGLAGERGVRIEAKATPAGGNPVLAGLVAALGEAVGEREGDAGRNFL
jgi:hypothetical protein